MSSEPRDTTAQAFETLRQLARRQPRNVEHCELCSVAVHSEHSHLIELPQRRLFCACDACALLFSGRSDAKFKLVPREVRRLNSFHMTDAEWDGLLIPINLAFFLQSGSDSRVTALYPSPAGATESLLYEGYMLYPYRPSSVKNRQRWNFGVLYPQAYSETQGATDACTMRTVCLITGTVRTLLEVRLRFLHLQLRWTRSSGEASDDPQRNRWQEVVERDVAVPVFPLEAAVIGPVTHNFQLPAQADISIRWVPGRA